MKTLTVKEFAENLLKIEAETFPRMQIGLKIVSKMVEKTAKSEIGEYQAGAGKFPAWAPLAESTEKEKARLGYNKDEPLLRTGALRDSISHKIEGLTAVIGSTSQIMVYHEYGTVKMPARPVIGLAAYKNKKNIRAILSRELASLVAGKQFAPSFSYSAGDKYSFAGVFKY